MGNLLLGDAFSQNGLRASEAQTVESPPVASGRSEER
jgi:hypothetical protein